MIVFSNKVLANFEVISVILTHNHDYETRELTHPSLRFHSPWVSSLGSKLG